LRRNLDGVSLGLTGPNITSHVVNNTDKVLAFHRWGAGPNDQVMVVMNFSNKPLTNYSVGGFPADGTAFPADGGVSRSDGAVNRPEVNGDAGPGTR